MAPKLVRKSQLLTSVSNNPKEFYGFSDESAARAAPRDFRFNAKAAEGPPVHVLRLQKRQGRIDVGIVAYLSPGFRWAPLRPTPGVLVLAGIRERCDFKR